MEVSAIEAHYRENFNKLVKRWGFKAGSIQAGEDVVQTAYERALRYRLSCDPPRFNQWFSMLMVNAFRDYRALENGYSSLEDLEHEEEIVECSSFPEHILREIYELIETKSVAQVQVLTMHFKYGYSAMDISKQTEYSYAKSHQIIQRFRNELRELYK